MFLKALKSSSTGFRSIPVNPPLSDIQAYLDQKINMESEAHISVLLHSNLCRRSYFRLRAQESLTLLGAACMTAASSNPRSLDLPDFQEALRFHPT